MHINHKAGLAEMTVLTSATHTVCDRIGNSGRNRIAMIWPEPEPEPEPDCHPKKVAGFDRIGRI